MKDDFQLSLKMLCDDDFAASLKLPEEKTDIERIEAENSAKQELADEIEYLQQQQKLLRGDTN